MTFVVGCSRFVVWSRKPGGQRLNDVVIVGLCASPNRAAQAWGPAVPSGVTEGVTRTPNPHMIHVSIPQATVQKVLSSDVNGGLLADEARGCMASCVRAAPTHSYLVPEHVTNQCV